MFFALSKIIYWLVMPVGLIAWSFVGSFIVKRIKHKRALRFLGLALFFCFTNPLIANWTMNCWEPTYQLYDSMQEKYDCGIVLSGITDPDRQPFDRIHFHKGADRIVHAIDLFHQGIIQNILITGGSGLLTIEGHKESHKLSEFAIKNGVPRENIIVEDQARNTHENATLSARIITEQQFDKTLLITSAFHMYRAKRCFEKAGVQVSTFPTDHIGNPSNLSPDEVIIPSINGLKTWTILTKEWLGIVAYKIAGYI